jgi:uncharacterized membrane protein YqjE
MSGKGGKSIGELVSELIQEVRTLFRQELELFTVEMKEKMAIIARDAATIGLGGIVIYYGILVLLAALVLGLATVMPAWGAALLTATVLIMVGFAMVQRGRKELMQVEMKPVETTQTLKETVKWAQTLRLRKSNPRPTGFANKSGIRKAI